MMKKTMKMMLGFAALVAAMSAVSAFAAPSVTVNEVKMGDPWSTITVKYTLSDVDTSVAYKVKFDVTADGVTKSVMDEMAMKSNTSYTRTIDTKALFGSIRIDAKAKAKVSIIEVPAVQLWADGPFFATCNIGATKPEEAGYYFWWGDTVGYTHDKEKNVWVSVADGTTVIEFDDDESPANTTYQSESWLRENGWIDSSDNLTEVHDAARAHLGAPWRMPTSEEFDALMDNCDTVWTDNWNNTGVSGCIVTGRGAYSTKSIFLPAAGSGLFNRLDHFGKEGSYWSVGWYESYAANAKALGFNSEKTYRVYDLRYTPGSIRPVIGLGK